MGLFSTLKEEFSSAWILLNDTTNVLARSRLFPEYEKDLREWRQQLQLYSHDPDRVGEVKEKLKGLRTFLREQGVELILGQKDIVARGWRHDDALAEGFRRCVLLVSEKDVFWITGTMNHSELKEGLARKLKLTELDAWPGVHSLWYRWSKGILEFSGADSEDQESWETFRRICELKKNFLIKRLKSMA